MHTKNAIFLCILVLGLVAWYHQPPVRIPNYINRSADPEYAHQLGGLRAQLANLDFTRVSS